MQLSNAGAADITLHEGVILKYYLDAVKVPTIGIGFTWGSMAFRKWWSANRPGQKFGPGATMTRQECTDCLRMVIEEEYGAALNNFLGKEVPQNVFDAACSVLFNCGIGALKWKWAKALKNGDYTRSAAFLRTTAITAKRKRLDGLVRRRSDEAKLLESGIYASLGGPEPSEPFAPKPDPREKPAIVSPTVAAAAPAAVAAAGGLAAYWQHISAWMVSHVCSCGIF